MTFTIEIDCTHSAFCDEDGETHFPTATDEIARLLAAVAERIGRTGELDGVLRDINGNHVGSWTFA